MSKCGSQGKSSVADSKRDVMNYQTPVIPDWSPFDSMKPGIGGVVRKAGSQGGISFHAVGGAPGIKSPGGEGRGMGTNRKG